MRTRLPSCPRRAVQRAVAARSPTPAPRSSAACGLLPALARLPCDATCAPTTSRFCVVAARCRREPGSNDEIMNTLKYVRPGSGFTPAFPLTQKLDVNGLSAHSFWSTARAVCPSPSGVYLLQFYPWTPVTTTDVAWNFEKVLLDVNLRPIRRYASTAAFSTIEADLKWLLG